MSLRVKIATPEFTFVGASLRDKRFPLSIWKIIPKLP